MDLASLSKDCARAKIHEEQIEIVFARSARLSVRRAGFPENSKIHPTWYRNYSLFNIDTSNVGGTGPSSSAVGRTRVRRCSSDAVVTRPRG
jgi:hypothetical protein